MKKKEKTQAAQPQEGQGKKKKKSHRASNIILVLILLVGAGIAGYPAFSEYWNSMHQSRAIMGYAERVAEMSNDEYAAVWDAICKKDYDLATKYQRRTNILNAVMCAVNNIAAYKVILKEEGIISTTAMRRPMENLSASQEQDLLDTMKKLDSKHVLI